MIGKRFYEVRRCINQTSLLRVVMVTNDAMDNMDNILNVRLAFAAKCSS